MWLACHGVLSVSCVPPTKDRRVSMIASMIAVITGEFTLGEGVRRINVTQPI